MSGGGRLGTAAGLINRAMGRNMADTENLVLEMLKGLRNDVGGLRSEMREQLADIKQRMLATLRGIGGIKRDAAGTYEDQARQQASIDALVARIEHIERRLELR